MKFKDMDASVQKAAAESLAKLIADRVDFDKETRNEKAIEIAATFRVAFEELFSSKVN